MKIKYDLNLMKFISLFENVTRSKVKDCIDVNPLMFVVMPGEIGKAIGKKGANIIKIEKLLKKKIKIVEFSDDPEIFLKNLIMPIRVENITKEEDKLIVSDPNTSTKGKVIGREASNLRFYESILARYFSDITEIKVV